MNYSILVIDPLSTASALDAKQRLIEAGLEIFGALNLEGATTRQLAQHAGVNQAAIPYYFGGKEGLYLATIEHFFAVHTPKIRALVADIEARLASQRIDRTEALGLLKKLLEHLLEILLRQQTNRSIGR